MKRTGKRGVGKWQAISWEEAIDLTGKNLLAIKDGKDYDHPPNPGGQRRRTLWLAGFR
jgi:anaerobic selenocysteine-containing dehydrogenase